MKSDGKKLQVGARVNERVIDAWGQYQEPATFYPEAAIADDEARSSSPHEVEFGFRMEVERAPVLGLIAPCLGPAPWWEGEWL